MNRRPARIQGPSRAAPGAGRERGGGAAAIPCARGALALALVFCLSLAAGCRRREDAGTSRAPATPAPAAARTSSPAPASRPPSGSKEAPAAAAVPSAVPPAVEDAAPSSAPAEPVPPPAVQEWQSSNEVVRARARTVVDLRKRFFDHERRLREEDPECVRLAGEIEKLRQDLAEREDMLQRRIEGDAEWLRLREEMNTAHRDYMQRRQQAMAGLRQAAGTNIFLPPPDQRPPRHPLPPPDSPPPAP